MRSIKAALIALSVLLAVPSLAHAQYEDTTIDFVGMAGGSVDKAALAASAGARLRFAHDWHVGLHAEYNPYGSVIRHKLRAGSANFFASIDYRWVKTNRVALTSIGYLGASWMLFDLYGVPKGSVGPYFGLTPLAVEVRLSPSTSLLVESARLAIPLPQASGVPFGYRQYRFMVGIAIALD